MASAKTNGKLFLDIVSLEDSEHARNMASKCRGTGELTQRMFFKQCSVFTINYKY